MSMTFTKLFSSITASTVWLEPSDTRVVWITMLAMTDRHGRVWASIPGLAKDAVVSVDACRVAISTFLSPDPDSRTMVADGRRVEPIDGGWRLINHAKYRALRDEEVRADYKAAKMREYRNVDKNVDNVDNVDKCGQPSTHVDSGSHNAEAEAKNKYTAPRAQIDTLYQLYPKHVGKADAVKAIEKALRIKPFDELSLAVNAYVRLVSKEGTEKKFIPAPSKWFNGGRYDDEDLRALAPKPKTAYELEREAQQTDYQRRRLQMAS